MPNTKIYRVLIWVAFLLYTAIVAAQMLYPLDRALPLAKIGDADISFWSSEDLAKKLNDQFSSSQLKLVTPRVTVDYPLGQAGAELKTGQMIETATNYPFWWRFVPLSIFFQPVQQDLLDIQYSQTVLDAFSKKQLTKLTIKPKSARLSIKNGRIVAESDQSGQHTSLRSISKAIKALSVDMSGVTVVHVPVWQTKAKVTAEDFSDVKHQAEVALSRVVVISVAGQEDFSVSRDEIASWLVVGEKSGAPALQFDGKAFAKYLETIDKTVGRPAGTTNITLTNGIETGRDEGAVGKKIDRTGLTDAVESWLLSGNGGSLFVTQLVDVPPVIVYNNTYTASQAGLRAYVTDMAQQMDVHIAIQQLGGEGWSARARAGESIPSASTYKLYVAKWLFEQMNQGKTSWNDPILDTTVSVCFDRMTIASTNPCAIEWLDRAGRSNINQFVYGLGFSHGTTFVHPVATHTTASDLMKFMIGLENGSLVSGAHRDRLLHSLSVHPYRSGVPAGSAGQVWDKVGFLWGYVHDAAIVRHPQGTYVIIVMTNGQSYAKIAEITRQVEKIMYP